MNPGRLLELYDRVADAPGAVERLRKFVLDLAVRGKLVEQNPADEPASELLKRIVEEKVGQASGRPVRKPTNADPHDSYFDVPKNWVWTHLSEISLRLHYGYTASASENEKDIRLLRITDIQNDRVDWASVPGCEIDHKTYPKYALEQGDILIARTGGTIGKTFLVSQVPAKVVFASYLIRVQPASSLSASYVKLFCGSSLYWDQLQKGSRGGGQPNVNGNTLNSMQISLPPLAEQHRIVAKADELMALLDRLETTRSQRETTRDRLTTTSLTRLTAPETTEADFLTHACFVLDNLNQLSSRSEQTKALHQTIFNLAVRGKLVEQNPDDEPAGELLKRIAEDKKQRAVSGRDRRTGSIRPMDTADVPFDLPSSWVWVAFGDITISCDGERVPVSKAERENRANIYDYYGASGVIDKIDGYLFNKPLLLIGEDGANLINRSTPIAFIARGKYWVNNHAHVLDGLSEDYLRYLELFINATDLKPLITGTAQPKLNQARMNSIPVALPPLAEQLRIVAKVDALMALCGQLQDAFATVDTTRARLLANLINEVLPDKAQTREAA